ncbi:hypothetical protein ONZ51_g3825 [Trametes cubensis]|uniref:Uncharacterized protein n=1 Tax=Trametes cubensis TaxID=1111947 RepID=A0AAD7XD52_9APHY|nr:hypothetical protein ONZ51_g3825 [Trametes cubensis]
MAQPTASVGTANMAGVVLSTLTYGSHLTLFLSLIRTYFRSKKSDILTRRDWRLLVYICTMFMLATTGLCLQTWINHDAFLVHRDFPGGPLVYLSQRASQPVNLAVTLTYVALNWLADGMLVRMSPTSHLLYSKIVVLSCVLTIVSLIVTGSVFLKDTETLSVHLWTDTIAIPSLAYLTLSFLANVVLTLVIVTRLMLLRRRIVRTLGATHTCAYTSVATMLIESASLYSVVAAICIFACALQSPLQNALLPMLGQLQGIPPLLIAIRVMDGRVVNADAWDTTLSFATNETNTCSSLHITSRDFEYDFKSPGSCYREKHATQRTQCLSHTTQPPSYGSVIPTPDDDVYTSLPVAQRVSRHRPTDLRIQTDRLSAVEIAPIPDEEVNYKDAKWFGPSASSSLLLPRYPPEAHTPQCTTPTCLLSPV